MTPVRSLLIRLIVLTFMVLALTANVAAADDGGSNLDVVPYDPGLPGDDAPPPAPVPWPPSE
ncbi:MAG: hypothetical protein E6I48_04745 [Chloroflexi bacterium]|nr:MAG: hypothetical protein E6I48_04745 [Chloroflexota bacterium]